MGSLFSVSYITSLSCESWQARTLERASNIETSIIKLRLIRAELHTRVLRHTAVVHDDVTILPAESSFAPAHEPVDVILAGGAVLTRHGRALVDVMLTGLSRETGSAFTQRTDVTGSAGL